MTDGLPPLFDAHCHLAWRSYADDVQDVLSRARAAGVTGFVNIGSGGKMEEIDATLALAEQEDDVWATAGVHPHDAAVVPVDAVQRVRGYLEHPKVVAVGECGLDYHYDHSPRDVQRRVFADFVGLARELARPLSVHTRAADTDTLDILRAEGINGPGDPVRAVIHCFSHDYAFGARARDLGCWLSVAGIVTFRNAHDLRDAVRRLGLEQMMVETDAPYLAPVPNRGKRNEPAWVAHTAREVAALLELPYAHVAAATTANARGFYRITSSQDGDADQSR